ncbi:hypothetical protein CVO_07910 [Sulfurimonas sp. CVO]|jgi:hypothetical protein|uniref:hypothetical protein n=1 Tax=Sulfurimonas sp. CVO TaxID=2283483 RepID=UPI00132EDA80|nr:hypothetical protein [Sulfurimonas sp. CVO]QHG91753.1 hypothetical protein CVO_07910 [Sulfurimonas sp. CVO]
MKTIQLEIEDKSLDAVLTLIHSLKKGMIKKYEIKEDGSFCETKAYFQNAYNEIKEGKAKLVPFNDGLGGLDDYIDSIK